MKILVVVDMQNDFITGSLGTKEALKIVPNVINKIKTYEENKDLIIYTKDTHDESYLNTSEGKKLPIKHCIKNTWGHEIPKEILRDNKIIIEKPTFGSYDLVHYIENLNAKSLEITLIGLCTDICVIANAILLKSKFYESKIIVDASCVSGVTVSSHKNALSQMKMCQIEVINE